MQTDSPHAETIVAIATALSPAAIGMLRLSGAGASQLLRQTLSQAERAICQPREAVLCELKDLQGKTIDQVVCIFYQAPNSFTGEDMAEIFMHGSPYLMRQAVSVFTVAGARQALAGEFTKRAYLNGKLDLSQAEAVADMIAAESAWQARVARDQLFGRFSQLISDLGEPLRELLVQIEAYIDFPEEDIAPETSAAWLSRMQELEIKLTHLIDSYGQGKMLREGAKVALVGLPNAGKSSLLNALLGEDRAIVTAKAGTTRDTIEERVSIEGLSVVLTDTAGIEQDLTNRTLDEVEQLGIERSWKAIKQADLVLFLFDPTQDQSRQEELLTQVKQVNAKLLRLNTKADLVKDDLAELCVSAVTGKGLGELRARLGVSLLETPPASEAIYLTTARHFACAKEALSALQAGLLAINAKQPVELIAADVKATLSALEDIIGVTHSEDILSRIFSKFCVGK